MGRNKRKSIPLWQSIPGEKGKKFIMLHHSLINSIAFTALKPKSKVLYMYMRDYSNGSMDFEYPHRIYKNIISNQGFQDAIHDLVSHGFIIITENGRFTRTENKYQFSSKWQTYSCKKGIK